MLDIKLHCGNCAWYSVIIIPKEKRDTVSKRGYCTFNPPTVFPVPQQRQSNLAIASGQQAPGEVTMLPMMMRPVVEYDDEMCGRYQPNQEIATQIAEHRQKQAGCGVEKCDGANCIDNCEECPCEK
jgi:hypothetical protein